MGDTMGVNILKKWIILQSLANTGGGGRIWTFDLRVMSPTHRNNISDLALKTWYRMVQKCQNGTENGTEDLGNPQSLATPGGGGRIWTFDLRVMSSMFPPITG